MHKEPNVLLPCLPAGTMIAPSKAGTTITGRALNEPLASVPRSCNGPRVLDLNVFIVCIYVVLWCKSLSTELDDNSNPTAPSITAIFTSLLPSSGYYFKTPMLHHVRSKQQF